jgi:hypothetical protein
LVGLLHHLGVPGVEVVEHHNAQHIVGPLTGVLARAAQPLMAAGLAATLALAWVRLRRVDEGAARDAEAARLIAAQVLVVLLAAHVLSPQFVLWMVPIVAATSTVASSRAPLLALLLAVGLTRVLFPEMYAGLIDQMLAPGVVLVLRNLTLVALLWIVVGGRQPSLPRVPRLPADTAVNARLIALFVVVVPFGLSPKVSPLFAQMLWLGRATVTRLSVPLVDEWTLLGSGEAFLPTGWLSGLLSYVVFRVASGGGVTVLRCGLVLASVALLVAFAPRGTLRRAGRWWVLILGALPIAMMPVLGPAPFGVLAFGLLHLCLHVWRRTGTRWSLAGVVVVQIVWTQLDATFVFAPLWVAAHALGCALRARAPGRGVDAATSRVDATLLFALAALCLLCWSVGPAGTSVYGLLWDQLDAGWLLRGAGMRWHSALALYRSWPLALGFALGMLAVAWLALRFAPSRRDPVDVCALSLATAGALLFRDLLPHAMLIATPIAVGFLPALARSLFPKGLMRSTLPVGLTLLVTFVAVGANFEARLKPNVVKWQEGVGRVVTPERRRVVLLVPTDAPYIILASNGQLVPLLDLRAELYEPDEVREWASVSASHDHERWFQYLDEHRVEVFVIPNEITSRPLVARLKERGWRDRIDVDGEFFLERSLPPAPGELDSMAPARSGSTQSGEER